MRLKPGEQAPPFHVTDINGREHRLEDYRGKKLLLSFHRYAACPLCNLHIHELTQAYPELSEHGLQILAIFMSPPERVTDQYASRSPPFAVAADPTRQMYDRYGVEYSLSGMLASFVHPRAMKAFFSGFMPGSIDADARTLPADFIIGPDLKIVQVYYSTNITQHMPISQIREWAAATQSS